MLAVIKMSLLMSTVLLVAFYRHSLEPLDLSTISFIPSILPSFATFNPRIIDLPEGPLYHYLAHDCFCRCSSCLKHLLSEKLQEKFNTVRHNQRDRYERRFIPLGLHDIKKEERCYLPDGTILEL